VSTNTAYAPTEAEKLDSINWRDMYGSKYNEEKGFLSYHLADTQAAHDVSRSGDLVPNADLVPPVPHGRVLASVLARHGCRILCGVTVVF